MADLIGHVVLFKPEEGGRRNPAYSGFTPMARMHGGSCAMACHFMSEDCLNPGESDAASITLVIPELCNRIDTGETFELEEQGRVVGRLTVLENLWKDRNRHKKATLTSLTPVLGVQNLHSSVDFYSKLGFEKIAEMAATGGEPTWVSLRRNDVVIMLRPSRGEDGGELPGTPHGGALFITTDDLATLHRSLQEATLSVSPIGQNADGDQEFTLADPDGWLLWFRQAE